MLIQMEGKEKANLFPTDCGPLINQLLSYINQSFDRCVKDAVIAAVREINQRNECPKQEGIEPGFISRSEAIRFLQISYPTLHRYQKSGLLPYHKVGRKVYFNKADLINATKVNLKRKGVRHD